MLEGALTPAPPRPARRRISRRDAARRALKRLSVSRPQAARRVREHHDARWRIHQSHLCRAHCTVFSSGKRRAAPQSSRRWGDGFTASASASCLPAPRGGARSERTATLPMGTIAEALIRRRRRQGRWPARARICLKGRAGQGGQGGAGRGRAEESPVRRHVSRDLRSRPGRAKSRAGAAPRPARDA